MLKEMRPKSSRSYAMNYHEETICSEEMEQTANAAFDVLVKTDLREKVKSNLPLP